MPSKDFFFRFLASGGFVSYIPARLTGFKKFTGSGMAGSLLALALVPFLPEPVNFLKPVRRAGM